MRYFYIDYENRKVDGFKGLSSLTDEDTIYIFYSKDAQTMTFGLHRRLCETAANIQYRRMPDSIKVKNGLDTNIMLEMENNMKTDRKGEYYIISADSDFDSFVNAKKAAGYKISKILDIMSCRELEVSKDKQNKSKSESVAKSAAKKPEPTKKESKKKESVALKQKETSTEKKKTVKEIKLDSQDNAYKKARHDKVKALLKQTNFTDAKNRTILNYVDSNYGNASKMLEQLEKKFGQAERKNIWNIIKSAF